MRQEAKMKITELFSLKVYTFTLSYITFKLQSFFSIVDPTRISGPLDILKSRMYAQRYQTLCLLLEQTLKYE